MAQGNSLARVDWRQRVAPVGVPGSWLAGWLLAALSLLGVRAEATEGVAPDHQRPVLDASQEAAWLAALTDASPHRQLMLDAPKLAVVAPVAPTFAMLGSVATPAQPAKTGKQLLGYLPYWTKSTAQIPWARLTQLAWFSAEIDATGKVSDTTGWGGEQALGLRQTAHQNGVQFILTITNFNSSDISSILASEVSRSAAISAIVAKVVAGQGDGANIDFEGIAKADKAKMVSFATSLRTELSKAIPGSHLSLATPAVDWNGAWDYDALAETTDGLMIMAYAIHYGGGNPGPQLPMATDSPWSHKTLQWIVEDYLTWGGSQNAAKFYVGLPLYGYTWPSSSGQPGAAKTASGKAIFFDAAQTKAKALGGWQYDAASQSPYVAEQTAGGWQQTWCDSETSFAARVAYADQHAMQIGLWALGYADASPGVGLALEQWQTDQPITGTGSGGGADAGAGLDAGGADAGSASDGGGQTADASGGDASSADGLLADTGGTAATDDVWVWDPSQHDLGTTETAPDGSESTETAAGGDSALGEAAGADSGAATSAPRGSAEGCSAGRTAAPGAAALLLAAVVLLRRRRWA